MNRPDQRQVLHDLAAAVDERTMTTTVAAVFLTETIDGRLLEERRYVSAARFDPATNCVELVCCQHERNSG